MYMQRNCNQYGDNGRLICKLILAVFNNHNCIVVVALALASHFENILYNNTILSLLAY